MVEGAARKLSELASVVSSVVKGKERQVRLMVAALLADGHVLLEDIPGVGKTLLARALAKAVDLDFKRIQLTSDTLPSDILGGSIFDSKQQTFRFIPGPIFANLVLADEINRAPPRTQSALLEAMGERSVSVDKTRYELKRPFMLVATQNPLEFSGTYPLPESQLDRFLLRLSLGYPDRRTEMEVVSSGGMEDLLEEIKPVLKRDELVELQKQVRSIWVAPSLLDYVMSVVEATRNHHALELGVSPRGAISWLLCAKAIALMNGRDYLVPDDLKRCGVEALAHRVLLRETVETGWERTRREIAVVSSILDKIPVPRDAKARRR